MRKHHLRLTLLSVSMLFTPCYEGLIEESNGVQLNFEEDQKEDDKDKDEKRSKKYKEHRADADDEEGEKKKEKEFHHFFEAVFLDADGETVLYRIHVLVGEDVEYHGKKPHKRSHDGKSYVFIGWDKPLDNIQSDTVFYPEFEEVTD